MRVLAIVAVLVSVLVSSAETVQAEEAGLSVELNKLEPADDGACRAFFLFRNGTGQTFEEFELSIAILNSSGLIDRLLSVDAAPLPVARTTLKLFDVPDLACDAISEMIVHDIPACKPENEDAMNCFPIVTWSSLGPVSLGQ